MATPQFPRPDQFATDKRVKLVSETGCYTFVDPADGMEYEFDQSKGAWFPMWNETLVEQQQSAYGATQLTSECVDAADQGGSKRKGKDSLRKRENTSVYISGLPSDTTEEEVGEYFSQCGTIMPDILTDKPRVKLYRNSDDTLKGDALVTFFKAPSVQLAIDILDDSQFRAKEPARISVQQDVTLVLDLAEDVRSECEMLGTVTSVKVYDLSENGVVAVKFKDELSAQACVKAMNGRFFAGRQIEATIYDGHTRYRSSAKASRASGSGSGHPDDGDHQGDNASEHSDEEEQRMEKYSQWLEAQH
ncbi:hypothetical protein GGF42_002538 [Coemansia sp. RSA 2424]|nr:hypothetical protein GGF42_002538 [Coemansia sp. RSA 2424]